MPEAGQAGLFGALAERAAPERAGGGAPRLRTPERRQVELRAVSLDKLLAADHRARFVWAFAERLELTPLYARIKAVEGSPGHPPADPRLLLALWLYATVEGVGSARELDRLCREHVGFQWLCGGVTTNHKTLADFRVVHGPVLEKLLVDSFSAMLRTGQAALERVAQDGMRVRAAAGAASFRRHASLERCREAAAAAVRRLRAELEADPGALSRRQAAQRARAANERERRVTAAIAVVERIEAGRKRARDKDSPDAGGGGETATKKKAVAPRASTTDAEARVMKMADGGFRPAFNVGFASDTGSGMIAAVTIDNSGSDMGKLAPMSDKIERAYGRRPAEHLADGGFVALADIEALASADVTVLAPPPHPRDNSRDRYTPLADDGPGVAAWRVRMGTEPAKQVYKERAATAECANAQCRNHGLLRFLVRGLCNAFAVALWHALAHNMMCTWRLQAA